MTVVLDPTANPSGSGRSAIETVARPATIEGLTIGLLNITKPRGDIFLERVAERLSEAGATVKSYRKPTFAKPAPVDLRHEIATTCDAVIEALAD